MVSQKSEKITIHKIFWYFIIFSIIGLIIETIYCYITVGTIESRKGLIWGPFCPVYGVSAVILFMFLYQHKDKNVGLIFIYGFFIGSISEYILSYILESMYGMRFWDYGYLRVNLNGRICLKYSIYWGILSVILLKFIKPILDNVIDKIPVKFGNISEIALFIFLIIDCIFTVWGIQTYENRVLYNYKYMPKNNIVSQFRAYIEESYFTNERISTTFPNLRFKDKDGNEIWINTLIPKN